MNAEDLVNRTKGLHGKLADAIGNPGKVWCRTCRREQDVNAAKSLRDGWPKCCGYTMTFVTREPGDNDGE